MYVIAGATGRVGSVAARALLAASSEVRVLVRRPSDADEWEARGAEARIAALDDCAALTEALRGCAGFFTLLPFDLTELYRADEHGLLAPRGDRSGT